MDTTFAPIFCLGFNKFLDLMSLILHSEMERRKDAHHNPQSVPAPNDDQHVIKPWTDALEQAMYDDAFWF